ncbi:MAG: hypothetical protein Q7V88_04785 [Actinomycetota bacterium]|nr:hypothetical protein [Actinomycetota bacterium]
MLSTNAPTKQRKSVLPWAVAGVLGIAAAAFAVLWVGKSGDADDLGKERDALVADKGTLEADLVTANSSLESAQSDLAAASADLAAAEREQSDLEAQVADLETESGDLRDEVAALQEQVAQLESEAGGSDISDATARRLGEALGQNATPPLTTAEAQCFGREMINNVGVELMIEIGFSSNPTDNQLARLGAGLIEAAFACDIELSRLNL